MSESTKHPSRLWIVDTDEHAGFVVREVDVVPVHPEWPAGAVAFSTLPRVEVAANWAQYRITGKPEWLFQYPTVGSRKHSAPAPIHTIPYIA